MHMTQSNMRNETTQIDGNSTLMKLDDTNRHKNDVEKLYQQLTVKCELLNETTL
jgi:hypothetical protein